MLVAQSVVGSLPLEQNGQVEMELGQDIPVIIMQAACHPETLVALFLLKYLRYKCCCWSGQTDLGVDIISSHAAPCFKSIQSLLSDTRTQCAISQFDLQWRSVTTDHWKPRRGGAWECEVRGHPLLSFYCSIIISASVFNSSKQPLRLSI